MSKLVGGRVGDGQLVPQGEWGEQGDPLMPLLFSLGQHRGLCAVAEGLRPGEHLFAFLDDVHVASSPERSVGAHLILEEEMWRHAKIRLHFGKTVIWNKSGLAPEVVEALEEAARRVDPTAVVWRGNPDLSTDRQGVVLLGTRRSPSTRLLHPHLPLSMQRLIQCSKTPFHHLLSSVRHQLSGLNMLLPMRRLLQPSNTWNHHLPVPVLHQ